MFFSREEPRMRWLFVVLTCVFLVPSVAAAGADRKAGIDAHLDRHFEVLDQVRGQLEAGRVDAAADRANEFEGALGFIEDWARARKNMARPMNLRAEDEEARETIAAFLEAEADASMRRIEMPLVELARQGGEMPAGEYAERVEEMLAAFRELRHRGEALDALSKEFELQPTIWVYGPDSAGLREDGAFAVTYRVENLTVEGADGLDIRMEEVPGGDSLPVRVTPEGIDGLAPGEVVSVDVRGELEGGVDRLVAQLIVSLDGATELRTLQLRR